MAVIKWNNQAWSLFNQYVEHARIEYGAKTAVRWLTEASYSVGFMVFGDFNEGIYDSMALWRVRVCVTESMKNGQFVLFYKKNWEKFWRFGKKSYLCIRIRERCFS